MLRATPLRASFWGQDVKTLVGTFHNNLINGHRVPGTMRVIGEPNRQQMLSIWSPSDDVEIAQMHESCAADVHDAVTAARKASPSWIHDVTPLERSRLLRKVSDGIRAQSDRLATVEALSCGMPINDAKYSVESCASTFETFSSIAMLNNGSVLPSFGDKNDITAITRREPLGVVGLITPYNYPLEMGVWKMAPALAAGNTVVWKPPELAPLTACVLSDIITDSGIPAGVVNVVHGRQQVGEAIASHMDIDLVGFTGSIPGGVAVQCAAAKSNLKRCQLELGGNAALVVDRTYDRPIADAAGVAMACFGNGGQSCTSVRRIYVPREKERDFLVAVAGLIEQRKIGHALDPSVQQGPLISAQHLDRVMDTVKSAVRNNDAQLVCGMFRPQLPAGHFMCPTLLGSCKPESSIVQEELFGPVMCVVPYDTKKEVIDMANSTKNGLSANILSDCVDTVNYYTHRLRAGTVWVNCADLMNGTTPFGGIKASGYGKDLGVSSLDGYSNVKTVITHHRTF